MLAGEICDANYDPDLIVECKTCKSVLHKINQLPPEEDEQRYELFRVIGAGSVVTKDIPANSLAVGNPCKVVRKI